MASTDDPNELTQDYEQAGFGRHLSLGKRPALIVVDVVNAYLLPGSPLYAEGFVTALASCERLAALARSADIPVLFTRVKYGSGGLDGGLFYKKIQALESFAGDSVLGAFPDSLQPRQDELTITKQYASAFFGSTLSSSLVALGIDSVFITGFSTSGCVRATALDAMQHGFAPFVVSDACGDRDRRPHESNLFDLQAKYAEVIDERTASELMLTTRQRRASA